MSLRPTTVDSGRGHVQGLENIRTGQSTRVFIPASFAAGTALAGPAAGMYVGIAGGNAEIAQAVATYTSEALNKYLKATLPPMTRGPFNVFRKAIGDYHASTETVRIDLSTPAPETPVNRPVRDRAVKLFDAAPSAADQMKMVQNWGLEQMSGLVAAGALSVLPLDVASAAMDRFLALRFAARQGLAAKYPAKESASNPISIAIDTDAMMEEANSFVAAMRANKRTVDDAIQICRDVSEWLALACDYSSADEAFAMLAKS